MASCVNVVRRYRNCPAQQIETLWYKILKKGVTGDVLRDILMFYFQHKLSPPPDPKLYNALLMTFSGKGTTKKMKNVIYHILEEVCPYMEDSIIETVSVSLNTSVIVELLNSVFIGGLIPILDNVALKKFIRFLETNYVDSDEHGKILVFFCQIASRYPTLLYCEDVISLNNIMLKSLSATEQSSSRSTGDMEECFTVLSSVPNFNTMQLYSIYTFSMIKDWLQHMPPDGTDTLQLLKCIKKYCSVAVEQCFRQRKENEELQKSVLCEILDILHCMVQLNVSLASEVLLLVKRIHTQINEKFKCDYHDIYIFVKAIQFLLDFGDVTGYTPQHVYEHFLGDTVYRSYSSGLAALEIAVFLNDNQKKLTNVLPRFFPNIFKLIACHPSVLLEDFIQLIPSFISDSNVEELFCTILDLPVLSATLSVHQLPTLFQVEPGSIETQWNTILDKVKEPSLHKVYMFMLRKESGKKQEFDRSLQSYLQVMEPVSNHSLIKTCSNVSPLLLEMFFRTVERLGNSDILSTLLHTILQRISVVYNVPGYFEAVTKILSKHICIIVKQCPTVVSENWSEITNYISVLDNSEKALDFYINFVWAAGEFGSTSLRDDKSRETIVNIYEAVESTVYEAVKQIQTSRVSLKLLSIMCSTIVKLASQHEDLIPRVSLCLSKVRASVTPQKYEVREIHVICHRIDELTFLLKNPTIAANVLFSSLEENPEEIAIIKALGHFSNL